MLVDLSHCLETDCTVFPGDPPIRLGMHCRVEEDGYQVMSVDIGSHSGTHVDAPRHVLSGGKTIDEYDPDRFRFRATTVDLNGKSPREPIRVEEVSSAGDGDLLVLKTGWDRHWEDPQYRDHPYLTPGAADWCAGRGFDVAIDALNVDPTPSPRAGDAEPEGFPVHHRLLGSDCLILENLRNLNRVPKQFVLHAYPLSLRSADGAPIRAVAEVAEDVKG